MFNPVHLVSSLFLLAVLFGAIVMMLKSPVHTNALFSASADAITGTTQALEGQ